MSRLQIVITAALVLMGGAGIKDIVFERGYRPVGVLLVVIACTGLVVTLVGACLIGRQRRPYR